MAKMFCIQIKRNNNLTIVFIEDDGPGIPEDQYKNVFKPFFRIDKSRSLNKSGCRTWVFLFLRILLTHTVAISTFKKSIMEDLQVKIFYLFSFKAF